MGEFEKEFLWRKKVKEIACLKAFNAQIFNPVVTDNVSFSRGSFKNYNFPILPFIPLKSSNTKAQKL